MMREVVSRMRGSETPYPIWIKFCKVVDIPDVIIYANFGEDRLWGLELAGGQNLPFSINFDSRPYNTLALPCEYVMSDSALLRNLKRQWLWIVVGFPVYPRVATRLESYGIVRSCDCS